MRQKSTRNVREVPRHRARQHRRPVAWIVSVLAIAPACTQRPSSYTIEGSRTVESTAIDFGKSSTTAERFGLDEKQRAPKPDVPASGLRWTTPPGWIEKPASAMRAANFALADDERAECYLTLLGGDAGGLAANVNRWRTQISLSAMSAEDLEHLPRSPMFGRDAVLVDFTGTWKGMSGGDARKDWRLVGLLLVEPGGSAFLKLTGPDRVVAAQRDAFRALARSLRSDGSVPETTTSTLAQGAQGAQGEQGAHETAETLGASGVSDSAAGFTFKLPAGWRRAPDRPARAFTLFAGAGEGLECYVTTLGGDAGGALANVNRWRGQIGLPGITDADLANLPSVSLLGGAARLVECEGAKASLIGIASNRSERSVFVKMTGPRGLVKEQRAAFLAFCSSLSEARSL
jgi:hypothetical protein